MATVTFGPEEPLEVECVSCGELLELHQPDRDEPGTLLGLCPECGQVHALAVRELVAVEVLAVAQVEPAALRAG